MMQCSWCKHNVTPEGNDGYAYCQRTAGHKEPHMLGPAFADELHGPWLLRGLVDHYEASAVLRGAAKSYTYLLNDDDTTHEEMEMAKAALSEAAEAFFLSMPVTESRITATDLYNAQRYVKERE